MLAHPALRTRAQVTAAAARMGTAHGYHVGVAILDRQTGRIYQAGDASGPFASESVVKVLIATRLLVEGRMHGGVARTAYKMITQSDDASADALYGLAGGDGVMAWTKRHYHVPDLGSPPQRSGFWGNTHLTPVGLVSLYAKLAKDRKVAGWLLNAMHHATRDGSDGTYQYFGIASASKHAAIKAGWGCEYTTGCAEADFNSTGFVDHDRYAVALLARGPMSTYGAPISDMLTSIARTLLPGGSFPPPAPTVLRVSTSRVPLRGGTQLIIHGRDFEHVMAVRFGRATARRVRTISPTQLRVVVPPHAAGTVAVSVRTAYGRSPAAARARVSYIARPSVATLSKTVGSTRGGNRVTLTGSNLINVRTVRVGGTKSKAVTVSSPRRLQFTMPAHQPGSVHVVVTTAYGRSTSRGGAYTYVGAPLISSLTPDTTTTAATRITITGRELVDVRQVDFGGTPGTKLTTVSSTQLSVTAPAHQPGPVAVTVITDFGTSTPATLTYTGPPIVTTTSLPDATVGQSYAAQLSIQDNREGTWTISTGSIPPGLSLTGSSITGQPTTAGAFNFALTFTDNFRRSASQPVTLTVNQ